MTALDFPTAPSDGQIYGSYIYDATRSVWNINAQGVAARFIVSDTKPSPATSGDAWFDTNEGVTYVYYDDGDSAQWVETGSQVLSYNTVANLTDTTISTPADGNVLSYNGSAWVNGGVIISAPNYDVGVTSATNPSSYDFNFSGDTGLYNIAIDLPLTFTASNYREGSIKTARLSNNGGSDRGLTFPASWRFIGAKPTAITGSKVAILSITSFGTTEAECVASYIEEE